MIWDLYSRRPAIFWTAVTILLLTLLYAGPMLRAKPSNQSEQETRIDTASEPGQSRLR